MDKEIESILDCHEVTIEQMIVLMDNIANKLINLQEQILLLIKINELEGNK